MDKIGLNILLFFGTAVVTFSVATAQSCSGCNVNCRFNNVEILTQLIEAKVDRALNRAAADRDEPRKLHIIINYASSELIPFTSAKKSIVLTVGL